MSTITVDLNLSPQFAKDRTVPDALYELLANAISASSPENVPSFDTAQVEDKVVLTITNNGGSPLLPSHFKLGRGASTHLSAGALNQHGIGLKDAIAILHSKINGIITIHSFERKYNFPLLPSSLPDDTDQTIHLNVVPCPGDRFPGTKVMVSVPKTGGDALNKAFATARSRFLRLCESSDFEKIDSTDQFTMYRYRSGLPGALPYVHFVYVKGAQKQISRPLSRIYNITGALAPKMMEMISRDHMVKPKPFNKEIYPLLQKFAMSVRNKPAKRLMCGDEKYEFSLIMQPSPSRPPAAPPAVAVLAPPPAPALARQTISAARERLLRRRTPFAVASSAAVNIVIDDSSLHILTRLLHSQLSQSASNSLLYTMIAPQKKKLNRIAETIKETLRGIDGLSIARIGNSGSVAKNTAVPGAADIDMVVFLNGFDPQRLTGYAERIKAALSSRDCSFVSCADDILHCYYEDVPIDIVLTHAEKTTLPRYAEFQEGPTAVSYFIQTTGADHPWISEVVRAAKYWIHTLDDGETPRLKSLAVELIVLNEWKRYQCSDFHSSASPCTKRPQLFRRFLEFFVNRSELMSLEEDKQVLFRDISEQIEVYHHVAQKALTAL